MDVIRDDAVNWDDYLQVQDRARVRPASEWADEVAAMLDGTLPSQRSLHLPWDKTHGCVGLRSGELSIWTGYNGHGKSLLLGQVLLGLMLQGAKCCIASLEMRPRWTMVRMVKQAVADHAPHRDDVRAFHRWTHGRLWLYDQLGTVDARRMVALGRYVATDLGIQHLVVDSLLKCGLAEDDYTGQGRLVDELTSVARDTGLHVHLVAHARKPTDDRNPAGKYDIRGSASISDQADNVFSVWRNKAKEEKRQKGEHGDGPDAMLLCDKQRNGDWEGRFMLAFHSPSGQYQGDDGPCLPMWFA